MVDLINPYFVYIVANIPRGTLYTGVTNNLPERAYQHRYGLSESFSKRYKLKLLVYYEIHLRIEDAFSEKSRLSDGNGATNFV
jgi:predicted GIY-YIG superfamily endonuclease